MGENGQGNFLLEWEGVGLEFEVNWRYLEWAVDSRKGSPESGVQTVATWISWHYWTSG